LKPSLAAPKNAQNYSLRIIGGSWRGRKLSFPDVEGLRPTGDRIRETLFNWLAPEIQGARCLDLFSGSGALGLEALSRGAATSMFVERDSKAAIQLRANVALLKTDNAVIVNNDALAFLRQGNSQAPYHIVFIDPPFQLQLWQPVIDALEQQNWLADDATIYIESGRDLSYHVPPNWQMHRDKITGQVCYRLFYREK
jgi:16S rRNA (guanine966-N2)-methyltransferase